jgi:hypothetical protein
MEFSQSQPSKSNIKAHAVIYEVNLTVDVEVIEQFDQWLHQHTEDMLAIPGFVSASTSVPDVEDEKRKHRCVQYRLRDQTALDNYLQHHAEEMRNKSLKDFDGHFTAERRVLSVAEAALAKHGVCANCDAELLGRFCNVCGQREEPRVPTLGSLSSEFTNEMFGVGSKLWRSIYLLIFKPGQLTVAYLSGKRQKYMSPIRLYLLFSIVAFALLAFLNSHDGLGVNVEMAPSVEITDDVGEQTVEGISPKDGVPFETGLFSSEVDAQIEQTIKSAISSIQRDIAAGNTEAMKSKFSEPLPTVLFLFLPIVALLFKILYIRSAKYYVEHLIYVVHNHSFLFAALIFTGAITELGLLWPPLEIIIGLSLLSLLSLYGYRYLRQILIEKYSKSTLKALLILFSAVAVLALLLQSVLSDGTGVLLNLMWVIYVPFYLYRSIRLVYPGSRLATILSLTVIAIVYLFLLVVMLLTSALFVGFTYI